MLEWTPAQQLTLQALGYRRWLRRAEVLGASLAPPLAAPGRPQRFGGDAYSADDCPGAGCPNPGPGRTAGAGRWLHRADT